MSFEEDLFQTTLMAIAAAALFGLLIACLMIAPLIGLAAVPVVAFIGYRNSPQFKERKSREHTLELYQQTKAVAQPSYGATRERLMDELVDRTVYGVACEIYELEGYKVPPPPPPVCNSVEGARYRDQLIAYVNNAFDQEKVDEFVDELIRCLPRYEQGSGLFNATKDLSHEEIEELIIGFYENDRCFPVLRRQLDKNYREHKSVLPTEYKGDNCAFAYLKDTPLLALAERIEPINLSNRTSHMHVVGGSGHGKTSLIQYMISKDLEDDCTVVVIDNQCQMIPKLAGLDLPIDDVSYISPRHNLGINLFDVGFGKLRNNEEAVNSIVELLEYVLSALMGAELTPKQQLIFQYAIQLTIAIPNANIRTFLEILQPKGWADYADVVDELPEVVQEFFQDEFDNDTQFGSTKKEISWRIWGIMKNPTFARIFSAKENPIHMLEEMDDSRLILIDTDINRLGENGSSFFGRLFIAMILQAARRRFEKKSRPVYVYIDEAPIYFDKNLATMLETARKANIGLILAHQELEQARSKGLLSSLIGNTAIKFAGGLSDNDARYMAANMRCSYQFIKDQMPLNFAASIRGKGVYSVKVPTGVIERMDRRSGLDQLVKEMEDSYGYSPDPDDDIEIDPAADEEIKKSDEL